MEEITDNKSMRRHVQNILLQWEQPDAELSPLLTSQKHTIFDMFDEGESNLDNLIDGNVEATDTSHVTPTIYPATPGTVPDKEKKFVESFSEAFNFYEQMEENLSITNILPLKHYLNELKDSEMKCTDLLAKVEPAIADLNKLIDQYETVSVHTARLHNVSEKIVEEQSRLVKLHENIRELLFYFNSVSECERRLDSPTLSVVSKPFDKILDDLDNAIEFLNKNDKFKEVPEYLLRCHLLLSRSVSRIRNHVINVFENVTQQVITEAGNRQDRDAALALYYGKFQALASRVKPLISSVERRVEKFKEYDQLLFDCHQSYFTQREKLLGSSISAAVHELSKSVGDKPTLVRSSCAFIIHICQDEYSLFYHFFSKETSHFISYLQRLCVVLYDTLRPLIIHIYHLETLEEICSIIRVEMLEETVENNRPQLEAFAYIATQILQDVQERLVYRAHCYFKSDILSYQPSPGDLAYPEKLEMMANIAQTLGDQALLRFPNVSHSSASSVITDDESSVEPQYLRSSISPADLHGMWYPTVRRTLSCLSRLYRCIERSVFQGLSQEALTMCIKSLSNAAKSITAKKTIIDGTLFEIKHLLILREQTAPFQVDFTVKEMSLDFSQIRRAAFSLVEKRSRLFSMSSDNALLEFLLEGTPQVKEYLVDSRKEIDQQLKSSCELFIHEVTLLLAGQLLDFLEKVDTFTNMTSELSSPSNVMLAQQSFATPSKVATIVQETQHAIKLKLPTVHHAMQLYLSNRDTEFILFRPVKNNVVANFVQLQQLLSSGGYSEDDLILIGCPSPEQISFMLSSMTVITEHTENGTEESN